LVAYLGVYRFGGRLVPDFASYAHGGSAWSSPLSALFGFAIGAGGVKAVAVFAAAVCGWLVGSALLVLLVVLSPIGVGVTNAGADCLGAVAVTIALEGGIGRVAGSVAASLAHLVGGLSTLLSLAARRLGVPLPVGLALCGAGAMLAEFVLSLVFGNRFEGLQWRYLLPACVYGGRRAVQRWPVLA
jgi:hypothetical protein